MARAYITGGVGATNLATGVPYIRRITRIDGRADVGGGLGPTRADGLTCSVITNGAQQGAISFSTTAVDGDITVNDGRGKNWQCGTDPHLGGELLFVEFPSTTRTISVQLEDTQTNDAADDVRLRVCLAAEGQIVNSLDKHGRVRGVDYDGDGAVDEPASSVTLQPLTNGNFIEITDGQTATLNVRTKGIFIYIQKYAAAGILGADTTTGGTTDQSSNAGHQNDACVILVTAILDHEGLATPDYGCQTTRLGTAGTVASSDGPLKETWPNSVTQTDGIG